MLEQQQAVAKVREAVEALSRVFDDPTAVAGLLDVVKPLTDLSVSAPAILRILDPNYPAIPKREPLIQRMGGEYRVGYRGKKRFIASALVATNGIKEVATHGLDVVGISILGAADNDPTVLLDITREEAVKFARRLGLACGFEVVETGGGS